MTSFHRRARVVGFILAAAAGAAQAGERLHMPYACRFDGARVHMRPALEERSYAIIGPREHQIFSTCSPIDPGRCRDWFVYRFDFDCDGARVAWLDAAGAAARRQSWDAWVDDDRFRMRMNRAWAVARPRPFFGRRRWRRRFDGPGAALDAFAPEDTYARRASRIVTLPPGFAPGLGIPLTFSGGNDAIAQATGAQATTAPAPPVSESAQVPEPEPIPELPQRAPRALALKGTVGSASAATPPAQRAPEAKEEKAKVAEAAAPQAAAGKDAERAQETSGTASQTAASITPTIINAPRSAAAEAPAPAEPAPETKAEAADPDADPQSAAASVAPKVNAQAEADGAPASVDAPAETGALAAAPATVAHRDSSIQPLATGVAALMLASLAAFGVWHWRRGRTPGMPPAERDIADISFGTAGPGPALALEAPQAPGSSPAPSADDLPVPTTQAEALKLLGAQPDATLPAIKKIVDGLRRSWHPDLATSEPDRLHRERRLRQINVAWDLISKRPTAA